MVHQCSAHVLGAQVRGVVIPTDLMQRESATAEMLLDPQLANRQVPDPAYARRCRELCDQTGALLIVDEVRAGLRLTTDCSWSLIGVEPDLSSWGKCLANGHPLSVLLGNDKSRKAASAIYVTGSFWYQAAPMAAALETLRIARETPYLVHLESLGTRLREGARHRRAERTKGAGNYHDYATRLHVSLR